MILTPLLTTKLHIPPPRPHLVPRARLLARLDEGLRRHRRLTLISAPAGYGKSTLLSAWLAQPAAPVPVAWLTVDEGDNDPARFLAYLRAAFQQVGPEMGSDLPELTASSRPLPATEWLAALINRLAALPYPLLLVLDDYHLITAPPVHEIVAFLLDHLPANLHLVIATRADPPLALARLRARDQLTELRQAELCFTAAEAADFFQQTLELALAPADVTALTHRTEGWIAGLQLAALSLQGQANVSSFIAALAGSQRYILDYLLEEVLYRQPAPVQTFLLRTAILEQLCGPLCDAVLAEELAEVEAWREAARPPIPRASDTSQAMLDYLERVNLFVVPLDDRRTWYRYHQLFMDLLRQRLQQTAPALLPVLQLRASRWYEQHGLLPEAIEHALAAGAWPQAAALIEQAAETTLMHSEVATLWRWLSALPAAVVQNHPALSLYYVWEALLNGQPRQVIETQLAAALPPGDQARPAAEDLNWYRAAPLRAFIALFRGELQEAIDLSQAALEHLPENNILWRSLAAWSLSLASLDNSENDPMLPALEQIAQASQQAGNVMVAVMTLCNLAELHLKWGRLHLAETIYRRALTLGTREQGAYYPIAGEALLGLGLLACEWNDLEGAARYLDEGLALAQQRGAIGMLDGYITLARVKQAQGDAAGAVAALAQAQALAVKFDVIETDDLLVALAQAELAIRQGRLEAAQHWATARGLTGDASQIAAEEPTDYINAHFRKYEHLVLARLWLAQGRADEALLLLAATEPRMRARRRFQKIIEIEILRALACQKQGDLEAARAALGRALVLAEPEGYCRLFLDEGTPLRDLLERIKGEGGRMKAYINTLLAAFGPVPVAEPPRPAPQPVTVASPPEAEALSDREVEVLRLLVAGLTSTEIAQRLYIAPSTARSHIKSIYSKLGVHRRAELLERAHQ